MGRSRSRSRERRREEKRGRPSDDYPSSRDYDRVEGSRRTFTYVYRPFLSSCPCPRADKRARETDLSASCLIKETKLLLLMLLLRMHTARVLVTFVSLFVCICMYVCMDDREIDYRGDSSRGEDYREKKLDRRDRSRKCLLCLQKSYS